MPNPPVKQRLWQALRLSKHSTFADLSMVVGASKVAIYTHLRHWQSLGLVDAVRTPRLERGAPPLTYSLKDPSVTAPPDQPQTINHSPWTS
jgi:predicted ArsR family transcriptional regulator